MWKVPLLASLFLSTLLSLLTQPASCKARLCCRKDNGGGKCLVLSALLLQHFNAAISSVELGFISGDTRREWHEFGLCQAEINKVTYILTHYT